MWPLQLRHTVFEACTSLEPSHEVSMPSAAALTSKARNSEPSLPRIPGRFLARGGGTSTSGDSFGVLQDTRLRRAFSPRGSFIRAGVRNPSKALQPEGVGSCLIALGEIDTGTALRRKQSCLQTGREN